MYSAMFMAGTSTHAYNTQPDLKRPQWENTKYKIM